MSWDTTVGKLIEETGGILAAVAGAIALRWAARRWPDPNDDKRRRRRRTETTDDDPLPEED